MVSNIVALDDREPKGRSHAPDAAEELARLVDGDLRKVNRHVLESMQSPVALIPQLAGHIIAAGGKRLRPMLLLGASRLFAYEGERHIGLAACVEFIHTATLLHDDVVDDSDLRRGRESANRVWGNGASVLVGDFLFSRAFQMMTADGSLKVLKILSDASAVIAEGEVLQLLTANDPATTEEACLDVIRAKTATLFAAAARLGAVVAERPEKEEAALAIYGNNLGIAFQLIDDVLDYSADQAALGKTVGDDFREGKVTLPIILAWLRGEEDERDFWRRTIADCKQDEADLARAMALLNRRDALGDTVLRARHYGAVARDALGVFPDTDTKRVLMGLVDFVIERAH